MIFDMDFSGLHLDIALRQLLTEVHIPGEAQKIEKLVEVFARRYIECNQMFVAGFRAPDTIFVLAYAMVLLNTDLHNSSVKPERKMRPEDFVRNLRGIDAGADVDGDMVRGIYDRIRAAEFRQAPDHVTQVGRVEATITGGGAKRPKLSAATWRRLVCFCRVTEVPDINKKEKKDAHQRGLFLFNDLLVVTKAEKSSGSGGRKGKTSGGQTHAHRYSLNLVDLRVNMFRTQHHQFGVQLQERHTGRVAATFACRSYNDQQRFVGDLQESIAETEEMERARVFM
jgi:IQ motif/SEC7 domain-containing protein